MSRIFWDTMLFIYLLEDHPYPQRESAELLARAHRRGDSLYTSHLALGEIMAGVERSPDQQKARPCRDTQMKWAFDFCRLMQGRSAVQHPARAKRS